LFNNGFVYAKSNPLAPENDLFFVIMAITFVVLFIFTEHALNHILYGIMEND